MTNILAIDSSTEACSVALLFNEKKFERFEIAPRRHAELLLPMVDSILNEANIELSALDAIACCVGPGAFTGLRIAVSVAQGLAFAANLPCIAISSLQALAIKAFKQNKADICFTAIDARMQEVYFAVYKRLENSKVELIGCEQVISPLQIDLANIEKKDLKLTKEMAVCIGSGWGEYEFIQSIQKVTGETLSHEYPNAINMLDIALGLYKNAILLKPEELQPVYLRNNVAKKKLSKK